MLHPLLELEKETNYPTIRAILVNLYGQSFKYAKVSAVAAGLASYGFFIKLKSKEEFFFKIEAGKNRLVPSLAGYAFMSYVHDKHMENPAHINSAKCIASNFGLYTPVLNKIPESNIPKDLLGQPVSLVTKLNGKSLPMKKECVLNNPYHLSNYPVEFILLAIDNIIDMQRAGEEFCNLHPNFLSSFEKEHARKKIEAPAMVYKKLSNLCSISAYELERGINSKCHFFYEQLKYDFSDLISIQDITSEPFEKLNDAIKTIKQNDSLLLSQTKLEQLEKYIHQLNEAKQLAIWIQDGTFDNIFQMIMAVKPLYEAAFKLRRAKLVSHDANITNFILNEDKIGKSQVTQIDILTYLSSGPRIFDICRALLDSYDEKTKKINVDIAKIILHHFDERERLMTNEIKSLCFHLAAIEIGNKSKGLIHLMHRLTKLSMLGTEIYDEKINCKYPLKKQKERIEFLLEYASFNNLKPLIMLFREQTINALDLRSSTAKPPTNILSRNGLFEKPNQHQQHILTTIEFSKGCSQALRFSQ